MAKAQTGTESYVTCKTGDGRVKTLDNRASETTLPSFENYEKTQRKPVSGNGTKARPNAKKKVGLPAVDNSGYLPWASVF